MPYPKPEILGSGYTVEFERNLEVKEPEQERVGRDLEVRSAGAGCRGNEI